MSLTSIGLLSYNSLSKSASCLFVIERGFQSILKSKFPVVFPDNSFTGRAIHQCLDISHYLLGTALFLSPTFQLSASSRIAASILLLPAPLFCKIICQMSRSRSTYQFSDSVVQVLRVGVKFSFAIAAIKTLQYKELWIQSLEIVKATGFITAFVLDAFQTFEYLIKSDPKDFYLHLRWRL
jgi:hypothetical protein